MEQEETSHSRRPAPARQLCHGSNRELEKRPVNDICPVCEKRNLDLIEASTRRLVQGVSKRVTVYVIPSHLPKKK